MIAKVFFNLLVLGSITYDGISEKLRPAVKEHGIESVKSGKMTVKKFEQLFGEEYVPSEEDKVEE